MSDHSIREEDREMWRLLRRFGLKNRPLHDPLGDGHHTDEGFTNDDFQLAKGLSWFMGTLGYDDSSRDQWMKVVRALRVHKLKIVGA